MWIIVLHNSSGVQDGWLWDMTESRCDDANV